MKEIIDSFVYTPVSSPVENTHQIYQGWKKEQRRREGRGGGRRENKEIVCCCNKKDLGLIRKNFLTLKDFLRK